MSTPLLRVALLLAVLSPVHALAQETFLGGACQMAAEEFQIPHPGPLPPPPVCHLAQGCLQVDWNIAPAMNIEQTLALHRFDEKHPLRIHTSNVNLLRFKVKWTQEVVERLQGFETVTGLLGSVSPILSIVGSLLNPNALTRDELNIYLVGIELANSCLADITGRLTDVVIDRQGIQNRQRLFEARHVLSEALPKLLERRYAYLKSAPTIENYSKVAQRHDDLLKRVTEFLPLARNSIDGETTVMKQEQRNSVVLLTGQPMKSDGTAVGEAVTARYFVAWSKRVIYHAGYGYGRLKDFDFNQVRTLSGQDLFAATKPVDAAGAAETSDNSAEPEAVGFLTWELKRWGPNDRFGAGFTVGTGMESLADSIYLGGTVRLFSRLLVTGGIVAARATRGEGAVIDTTTSPGATRTLFAELRERTDRNPFWSVSFKVYLMIRMLTFGALALVAAILGLNLQAQPAPEFTSYRVVVRKIKAETEPDSNALRRVVDAALGDTWIIEPNRNNPFENELTPPVSAPAGAPDPRPRTAAAMWMGFHRLDATRVFTRVEPVLSRPFPAQPGTATPWHGECEPAWSGMPKNEPPDGAFTDSTWSLGAKGANVFEAWKLSTGRGVTIAHPDTGT